MKEFISLFGGLIIFTFESFSQILVTENDVRNVTIDYVKQQDSIQYFESIEIDSIKNEDGPILLYLSYINDSVCYVIPGTKNLPPVLAIINQSKINIDDFKNNFWINKYINAVEKSFELSIKSVHYKWNLSAPTKSVSNRGKVGPLIKTRWGQSSSHDNMDQRSYNYYVTDYCDSCEGYAPVGCVAVAMGQIMNYWKYPVARFDKSNDYFYDWCNMNDALYTFRNNYIEARNSVARLLKDCGEAVGMHYCFRNKCASFAWPHNAKSAFSNEFGYSEDIDIVRRSFFDDDEWRDLLLSNLENGMPVFYAAITDDTSKLLGLNGHAFICDGFDYNSGLFHFNMGWNGIDDDWYDVSTLITGDDRDRLERAIINIYPAEQEFTLCEFDLHLADYFHKYYDILQNEYPLPLSNIPHTATRLYSPDNGSNINWRTIPSGESSEYIAHKSVTLQPGFHAERGSTFSARIVPCSNCESEDSTLTTRFSAIVACDSVQDSAMNAKAILVNNDAEEIDHHLFPNPSHETITYRGKEVSSMAIYDLSGRAVYRWFVVSRTADEIVVNVKDLRPSTYVLLLNMSDGTREAKGFVKE